MPQSLSFLLVHIIFSVKDRTPLLRQEIRHELFAYLATIVRNDDCECFRVGGMQDHIHLAVRMSREASVATLVKELKTSSSRWLKDRGVPTFSWQRGYAAFSVGPRDVAALLAYIDQQEEHHRKRSFQEEYRLLLQRCGVAFDERYVWD